MKQTVRTLHIYDHTSRYLKETSTSVMFPLNQTTLNNIEHLKSCFKHSLKERTTLGIAAPQAGILQRFFIMPSKFNYMFLPKSLVSRSIRDF